MNSTQSFPCQFMSQNIITTTTMEIVDIQIRSESNDEKYITIGVLHSHTKNKISHYTIIKQQFNMKKKNLKHKTNTIILP
jgi:hypothetical protein